MARTPTHRLRPGWFRPVPLRSRRDGWSAERQCAFLAQLYLTRSVTSAARAVGMSRASAYRLREREEAESFETRGVGDFYVLAIDCVPDLNATLLPPVPGLVH